MTRWSIGALVAAVALLMPADVLAFHDLFGPHAVRDWTVLVASVLAVVGLAGVVAGGLLGSERSA